LAQACDDGGKTHHGEGIFLLSKKKKLDSQEGAGAIGERKPASGGGEGNAKDLLTAAAPGVLTNVKRKKKRKGVMRDYPSKGDRPT